MDESLTAITERLAKDIENWLGLPSEGSAKITELRSQIDALKDTLSGEALKAMHKGLREAEAGVKTERQKAAAEAISAAVRELGIRLDPGAPMKRTPRKKKAAPRAEQGPGTGTTETR
tara:strand:- start:488 stop:841 length:354 start_codon:yes stop_codon:yes gene_type:complete